ncbi:DUF1564 domain-containing protein [Leptospira sp. FAT2]|uniref:DUF1564 domain-containing protein n=1 Tax=Leptospira sanjuanensis TaxID=2879643 RepID=UPI001EE9A528|nr:DUF1564 domain-containing protein [Leptospira sanjuanensis]MCG6167393.1 DUF1564 domain-containing protein [Leptospira sanjuanensis]MCG6192820.1 DUF1564 domain-containing protein [Leptospira sanjuanensis]
MGILLLHSNHEIRSSLQEKTSNVVTLLVPEYTLLRYPDQERRNLPKRIPILLKRYSKFLSTTKRLGKKAGKTLYQPSPGKAKMKKINVRLSTGSWALFGTLAHVHGVSRCFLFNYLLWLETSGVGDSIDNIMNEGGPTFHQNYRYILDLDLLKNSIVRSLQCYPHDTFFMLDYRDWYDS